MIQLGRLEKVDARTVWANEASGFTPWLAKKENLELLAEAIGIELELEAQETNVGPFRADILCKDIGAGHWVLIENQLERTDHTHLGQLITYAAGLGAVTVVWVANRFTEEHRAALDWLNSITNSHINFFGLEVELWRIGDSIAAPKFNIVSKPNDWSKTVAEGASRVETETLTESKQLQLRYWTQLREHLLSNSTILRPRKPLPQNWMSFSIGRSGFTLAAVASLWNNQTNSYNQNEIRAEIYTEGPLAKQYYALLEAQKTEIEREIGCSLLWYNPDSARICRIQLRRDVDLRDETTWQEQHRWLQENLEALNRVFRTRIQNLNLST